MGQFDALFQPLTLNQLTIRNRIVSTAHAEVYAEDGMTTERYVRYYEEKAKGGVGLAICGGSSPVSIDSPHSWWNSVNVSTDRIIPYFKNLSEAMHKHGAKIMIQLTHMGRRSRWDGADWPNLITPSGVREPVHRGTAKTIEIEDIQRVIGDFAQAVRRVKEGGLDGAEISAAHQHLIDQFWSPRTNHRTDEYGGSLENRIRFGLQVFEAIREEVGRDFCVGLRMCGDEFHEDGLNHEDLKAIAQAYSESGLVDFISVVGSGADTHNTIANVIPNMAYPPEPFLHLAAGIKEVVDVPVMHAQNIKDPVQAQRILEEGYVDLVGMTRAHIADPYLVTKIREGRVDQIRQCVGANYCIDRQYQGLDVLCIQNAATSREQSMPHLIEKAPRRRRVVVVGGGPAGMEAARVSAERGHEVILLEKQEELGGQITIAAKAPARDQMAGITRWMSMELNRLGIDLRLGVTATPELLRELEAEIVVLATGGTPNLEEHAKWGAAEGLVVSSWDILTGKTAPAKNVLVYDAISQFAGVTCADYLAAKGSLVELVTPDVRAGDDLGGTTFPIYYRKLYAADVIMTPDRELIEVYREGDQLVAVLRNEYTGSEEERVVDQVVVENGTLPVDALYLALKSESRNRGQIDLEALYAARPQPGLDAHAEGFLLYRIGDCVSMRNIHAAIYDALRLCKDF
ncbi:MAG: NADH:flavin oxidoreductase [Candidatus Thiodiazotropha sp.]